MSPLIRVALAINFISSSQTFTILAKYISHLKCLLDSLFHYLCYPFFKLHASQLQLLGENQPSVCHYVSTQEDVDCAVCLSKMREREEIRVLRCGHVFHRECLNAWVGFNNATCPLCRDSLGPTREIKELDVDVSRFDFCSVHTNDDHHEIQWLR